MTNADVNLVLSPRPISNMGLKTGSALDNIGTQPAKVKDSAPPKIPQERPRAANETRSTQNGSANSNAPASKYVVN